MIGGFETFEVRDARVCGDGRLEVDFESDDYSNYGSFDWYYRHYFVLSVPGTGYDEVSTRTIRNCGQRQIDWGLWCHIEEVP